MINILWSWKKLLVYLLARKLIACRVHRQLNLSRKKWWGGSIICLQLLVLDEKSSELIILSHIKCVIWVYPKSMIYSLWITFSLSILKIGTDFRPLNLNGKRYAVVNSIIKTCFAGLSSSHFSSRVKFLLIHSLLVGSNFYPDKNWNMKISAIWLNNLNLHQI